MATPRDPDMCLKTGRLCTEWFEEPEFTDEQIKEMAAGRFGLASAAEVPTGSFLHMDPEDAHLQRQVNAFIASRKNRKWKNNMSQQEVAMRMNEATKMVDPSNFKFLDDATRERTGLELNPLWMIETLVRSGLLNPKEQVAALKELASFTHSKAPSINHNTVTHANPEEWLLELAKDEYKEIEVEQPKQPVERGSGHKFEKNMLARVEEVLALNDHTAHETDALYAEFEDLDDIPAWNMAGPTQEEVDE